ncbi:MAG: radical SAM family heme chaperone HemW, partial [Deltaproteobacteria bacterium]
TIGVYVHIPFCVRKCLYCGFSSVAAPSIPEKRYAECLVRELGLMLESQSLHDRALESIYIGGGTPSVFSPATIARIISSISNAFHHNGKSEITMEANPDTLNAKSLKGYRDAGVNRLSIGFQALDDRLLKAIGRTHDKKAAVAGFSSARQAGFENISIDLMSGLPGQASSDLEETLLKAVRMGPEHISLYGLTIEESTPFYGMREKGLLNAPDEDEQARQYVSASSILTRAGYAHYEISNFSLPDRSSAHNSRYWLGGEYIGLGASAHSCMKAEGWGRRWWNILDPYEYMQAVEGEERLEAGFEVLSRDNAIAEDIMLGLRMFDKGIDFNELSNLYGIEIKDAAEKAALFAGDGFLKKSRDRFSLTLKCALVSNEVFSALIAAAC